MKFGRVLARIACCLSKDCKNSALNPLPFTLDAKPQTLNPKLLMLLQIALPGIPKRDTDFVEGLRKFSSGLTS